MAVHAWLSTINPSCGILSQEKLSEAEKKVNEMAETFEIEEAKSIEMGAEMLTLVNQKTHLERVRLTRRRP